VRFGILTLPNRPWPELAAGWREHDEQGWDALYVADHLGNPYHPEQPWLDAWSCLGAMAIVTERARLGPLVTPQTFRNPASLTRAALTVDTASGGRLDLALGAGGSAFDHRLADVEAWPPRERADRFERFARRVRELLNDESLGPRPASGHVPLVLGGQGDRLLGLAAELADGWNTYGGSGLSAEEGRGRAAERLAFLDAACRETGRTVRRSILLGHRFVAEEPFRSEEAFAEVARAWHALGFDELVVYADPFFMVPRGEEPPPGIVGRIARDVLPELRRNSAPDAAGDAGPGVSPPRRP
jgi:alkanesulfonate monooxygenase SsuD/methylene tetrahydromethanopterin reductase-like flavin-dependent oxidoreductase (luciferase family)